MAAQLFQHLQLVHDIGAWYATFFDQPSVRSLIVSTRTTSSITYFEIEPTPVIHVIKPEAIALYQNMPNLKIEMSDLQVKGISRRYVRSKLVGRGVTYWVDADLSTGTPQGGFECEAVSSETLMEESGVTWSLLIRRMTR